MPTEVRRIEGLPAGAWLLRFDGNPQLNVDTALHVICQLEINGDAKAEGRTVAVNLLLP